MTNGGLGYTTAPTTATLSSNGSGATCSGTATVTAGVQNELTAAAYAPPSDSTRPTSSRLHPINVGDGIMSLRGFTFNGYANWETLYVLSVTRISDNQINVVCMRNYGDAAGGGWNGSGGDTFGNQFSWGWTALAAVVVPGGLINATASGLNTYGIPPVNLNHNDFTPGCSVGTCTPGNVSRFSTYQQALDSIVNVPLSTYTSPSTSNHQMIPYWSSGAPLTYTGLWQSYPSGRWTSLAPLTEEVWGSDWMAMNYPAGSQPGTSSNFGSSIPVSYTFTAGSGLTNVVVSGGTATATITSNLNMAAGSKFPILVSGGPTGLAGTFIATATTSFAFTFTTTATAGSYTTSGMSVTLETWSGSVTTCSIGCYGNIAGTAYDSAFSTTHVYKIPVTSGTGNIQAVNEKIAPLFFTAAPLAMFVDISGPGSLITDATTNVRCTTGPLNAGTLTAECRPNAAQGDSFISGTAFSTAYGACVANSSGAGAPCAFSPWPGAGWAVQVVATSIVTNNTGVRRLTQGLWTPPSHYTYSNWVSTPDAAWGIFSPPPINGSQQWLAMKLPPTSSPLIGDGVNRTTYIGGVGGSPNAVTVYGNTSGDTVRVQFGYGQDIEVPTTFSGTFPYCATRQEYCYTTTAATQNQPWAWTSEAQAAQACPTTGCTVSVPLIPGSVMYYRAVHANGAMDPISIMADTFSPVVGAASKLVFASIPTSGTIATALAPPVLVQVEDSNGNPITGSTASVVVSSTPAGVSGTLTVSAVSGVATFSNLNFAAAGTYSLTATSSGLTGATSGSTITVTSTITATRLAFVSVPATATAGIALSPAIQLQVQDTSGNLVTGSTASVTISSSAPNTYGTLMVSAVGGVATFSTVSFNQTGTFTLTAASPGLLSASSSITVLPGSATSLLFQVQPSNAAVGQAISPAPIVWVLDAYGNLVTAGFGSTVAVSVASTPVGVGGVVAENAVGGVATFPALMLASPGTYTLTATFPGMTGSAGTSGTLVVSPAPSGMVIPSNQVVEGKRVSH